jgi:hypothetical protein
VFEVCKATIDFSLPTNRGVTTEGKMTTSLKGRSGSRCICYRG